MGKHLKSTLLSYKHFSLTSALEFIKSGNENFYLIKTINWTLATERGKPNWNKVHHNIYRMNLKQLIKFIRDTDEVAEDIYSIEKESKNNEGKGL